MKPTRDDYLADGWKEWELDAWQHAIDEAPAFFKSLVGRMRVARNENVENLIRTEDATCRGRILAYDDMLTLIGQHIDNAALEEEEDDGN
jgi:hypothetical protein